MQQGHPLQIIDTSFFTLFIINSYWKEMGKNKCISGLK